MPDSSAAIPNIDLSRWPLVQVHWPKTLDREFVDAFLSATASLSRRGEAYAIVINKHDAPLPTAANRKMIADRISQNPPPGVGTLVASAVALQSSLLRGALTAISWLLKRKYPVRAFTSHTAAIRWARAEWLRSELATDLSGARNSATPSS